MLKIVAAASVVAAIAVPAAVAAQTSTTNCTRDYFGNIRCTTQQRPGLNYDGLIRSIPNSAQNFEEGYQRGQRMREAIEQREQAESQREQVTQATRLIADGDCPGAERYALLVGNMALAKDVRAYCGK